MCQCGCADFQNDGAHKVGENILVTQVYPSCGGECDTPFSVFLHMFSPAEAQRWGVDIEKAQEFKPGEHGWDSKWVSLFEMDDLIAVAEATEDDDGFAHVDLIEYDTLANLLRDYGRDLIRAAIFRHMERKR